MKTDSSPDRFEIRQFSTGELLPYLKREEVEGYCRNCDKYGISWSCPPHAFDPETWFLRNRIVVLVARVFHVDPEWSQEDAFERYFGMTRQLNFETRKLESVFPEAVCLYAGQCDLCEGCTRSEGKPCRAPHLCRYSLESLGFKVSEVMSELMGLPLQWSAKATPERFVAVSALLLQNACDESEVLKALEQAWSGHDSARQ